ncbi:MAG: signal peptide peptidase SppA [candidate division Zixibacteria bacterium]|nr:signal peptide peptidase SppA [candidate division Zixibacteria bacterium]
MSSKKWWFLAAGAAVIVLFVIIVAATLTLFFLPDVKPYSPFGRKIAVLDIRGGITSSEGLIKIIHGYRDDPTVAAVVLYVDSPGGSVAPVQEVYTELLRLKDKNKKIYAYMSTLGASGAYYVACSSEKIYASPGTATGSVGVIMTFTNVEGLFGKIGLSSKTVKSGRYKDIGSPFRPMTPEEEALLGETVDDLYQQFLDTVVEARRPAIAAKLKAENEETPSRYRVRRYVLKYADGRIFSGRQAQELGFVDELGNFQKCLRDVAKEVGIKGRPTIVRKRLKEKSIYEILFGRVKTELLGLGDSGPRVEFKYSLY